jgi:ATP-binding cassette subfamily B protein
MAGPRLAGPRIAGRGFARRGIHQLLWPHIKPQGGTLTLAFLLGLSIAALSAAQPLLTRVVIDQGLIGRQFPRLVAACLGMLALALSGFALGGLHRAIYIRASGRTLFSLRGAVYAHLLRVSPRRLARVPVGDLVSRLDGDIAEVQRFGTDAAAALVSSVLTLIAVGAVMLSLSWRLSLVIAALMPLQLLVRHYARPRIEASTRSSREASGRLSGFLVETLAGARAVQAAAAEDLEGRRLGALGEAYLGRVLRQQLVAYATSSIAGLLGHLATAATFVLGGWYVLNGQLSVGTLVAFIAYLGRSSGSAASIASLYTGYQRARVSLERVEELLDLPVVVDSPHAIALPADARGALRFEAVSVTADGGPPLLDAVSIDIPAGSKVVLRGASGAGKSTLADLLRRFLEPDSGRILLDGRPLDDYRLADLRRRIVVVEHSPVLFRGSILDNLRYGHPEADEASVLLAARQSRVDDFVSTMSEGYGTWLSEGGSGLSTGQRQRIAIARAALARPLIVVLDEATSGLDAESARAVHRSLDIMFGDRTRLVITHRADDIERSDLCLSLESGRLSAALLAGR